MSQLKQAAREHQNRCQRRPIPKKHKYIYLLGRGKKETQRLYQRFKELNPNKVALNYPKDRGGVSGHLPSEISLPKPRKMTQPQEVVAPVKKCFYSIGEISAMYGISQWLLYYHIKTDPSFPHINIGAKKKFLIGLKEFDSWLTEKGHRATLEQHLLPDPKKLAEKLCG